MKKWGQPTVTIIPAQKLSSLVKANARSIKCEKAYVR